MLSGFLLWCRVAPVGHHVCGGPWGNLAHSWTWTPLRLVVDEEKWNAGYNQEVSRNTFNVSKCGKCQISKLPVTQFLFYKPDPPPTARTVTGGRITLGEGGFCGWQVIYEALCLCWSVVEHLAVSDDVFAGVCGLCLSLWLLSNYIILYSSSCTAINPRRCFCDIPACVEMRCVSDLGGIVH